MTRIVRPVVACGVLLSALLAVPVTRAQKGTAAAEPSSRNVLVTFRIGVLEDTKRVPVKSYDLVVADGSSGSELLSGARVPIPIAKRESSGADDDDRSTASYVYQNIGFSTQVEVRILDGNKIRMVANIEDSRIREGSNEGPPTVETRQLTINAILADGAPLDLTRVKGVTERSGYVEVEATILR